MVLTNEQVVVWRRVLVNMGMMEFVVNRLTKEEIEKLAENIQKRITNYSNKLEKQKKPKFVSKFSHKRF